MVWNLSKFMSDEIHELIKAFNRYGFEKYGTRFFGCKLERKEHGHVAFTCEFDADMPKENLDQFLAILPHTLERIEDELGEDTRGRV